MNTKLLMAASAIVLAALGLAATFMPEELLHVAAVPAHPFLPLVVQLLGALYLSFAMLNWMAKDSAIGGIYNHPVLIGNVLHFTMGALALLKGLTGVPSDRLALGVLAGVYALFAIGFGMLLFRSPKPK
jgi:hypothetical protein